MDGLGLSTRFGGALPTAAPQAPRGGDASLQKTAREFEAMYLGQMLKPMFENLTAEAPFGGGLAEEFWRSFEVEEFSKALARAGGVGIAQSVYRQLEGRAENGGIRA